MRRLQVWFEDAQYERLRAESARTGNSIDELVRAALDDEYGRPGDEGGAPLEAPY